MLSKMVRLKVKVRTRPNMVKKEEASTTRLPVEFISVSLYNSIKLLPSSTTENLFFGLRPVRVVIC